MDRTVYVQELVQKLLAYTFKFKPQMEMLNQICTRRGQLLGKYQIWTHFSLRNTFPDTLSLTHKLSLSNTHFALHTTLL